MGRPSKRKTSEIANAAIPAAKNQSASESAKKKQKIEHSATSTRSSRASTQARNDPRLTRSASNNTSLNNTPTRSPLRPSEPLQISPERRAVGRPKKASVSARKSSAAKADEAVGEGNEGSQANVSVAISSNQKQAKVKAHRDKAIEDSEDDADADGHQYWLMKAEPESRIEKGKDVKFSIDDLKAASSPEPWDGVRNLEARNNMRAMIEGDLAFFYHSNCKVPGIVGVMEIVEEHSIDESAFDPEHPYYDEKSSLENPKWHLVHVAFRQKFPEIIKLKELQKFSKEGGTLENMQTLRRSRLSVSKVSKKEWNFIMSLIDIDDLAATNLKQAEHLDGHNSNSEPQLPSGSQNQEDAQGDSMTEKCE